MEFHTVINQSISVLTVVGWYFTFYSNSNRTSVGNSGNPDQKPRFAASALVLHRLLISHRNDARLICVNYIHVL